VIAAEHDRDHAANWIGGDPERIHVGEPT
jgi:hypothetical protein